MDFGRAFSYEIGLLIRGMWACLLEYPRFWTHEIHHAISHLETMEIICIQ